MQVDSKVCQLIQTCVKTWVNLVFQLFKCLVKQHYLVPVGPLAFKKVCWLDSKCLGQYESTWGKFFQESRSCYNTELANLAWWPTANNYERKVRGGISWDTTEFRTLYFSCCPSFFSIILSQCIIIVMYHVLQWLPWYTRLKLSHMFFGLRLLWWFLNRSSMWHTHYYFNLNCEHSYNPCIMYLCMYSCSLSI